MFSIKNPRLRCFQIGLLRIFALVLVGAVGASAATVQWTNTLGGNWNVAQNWNPNAVPVAPDVVVITNDGSYMVNLNVSPTISRLVLGGTSGTQTLAMGASSLTVNSTAVVGAHGRLNLAGGGLTVTAGLTLDGAMEWSGGTIPATSKLIVTSNGIMTVTGANGKSLFGVITNNGAITSSGSGGISGAGTFHNQPNGLFDASTVAGFAGSQFINHGTLRKSGSALPTAFTGTLINHGTIDAQVGTILLSHLTLGDGSSYIGAGTSSVSAGILNGDFTSENLVLAGNALSGVGRLHGSMIWSNGTFAAGTVLNVASNGTFTLLGTGSRTLTGVITNAGTINWMAGGLSLTPAGILHILPGGLVDATHSGSGSINGGLFVNAGTVRKSSGTGTVSISALQLVIQGIMDAQTGSLSLGGSLGGGPTTVVGDGSSFIGAGANLLSGNVTLAGTFTSENLDGLTVVLQGNGTMLGSGRWIQNCSIADGAGLTVASNATLTLMNSLSIGGGLTNSGIINLQSSVLFNNGTCHNLPSGIIDLKANGTLLAVGSSHLHNDGLFQKSAGLGTNAIAANLAFINNGTILAQTGTILFSGSLTNPAGTLALAGGRIQSLTPLVLPGGRLTGSGILETPSLTSAAVVSPGATNAILTVVGNYTQQLAGNLEFHVGGSVPGINQSQVIITGDTHLNGLISVLFSPGYLPDPGIDHIGLQTAALTGDFKCFNGLLLLGENRRLNISYGTTNLVLTAVSAPDPLAPTLGIARADQTLICWPAEFTGFNLYSHTNLNGGDWSIVPTTDNRHFDSLLEPQKFFRLSEQQ